MTFTADEKAIIFLDSIESFDYRKKSSVLGLFSRPRELFDAKYEDIAEAVDEDAARIISAALRLDGFIDRAVDGATANADGAITFLSADYPQELKDIDFFPLVLYYRGNRRLLAARNKFSVVGSRKTLPQYYTAGENVAEKLAESGVVIVTGIAEGGDGCAAEGSVKSGNLISVIAGGIDRVHPRNRQNFADEIAKSGLLITESPSGTVPKIYFYPIRNRIIAALGRGTLIVSGSGTSGARYTAAYAAEYGKDVFCFPYGLGISSGELCKELLKNGAYMVESAEEIAEICGFKIEREEKIDLDGYEKVVYDAINGGVTRLDKLMEKTGLKASEMMPILGMLELKRLVVRDSGGNVNTVK